MSDRIYFKDNKRMSYIYNFFYDFMDSFDRDIYSCRSFNGPFFKKGISGIRIGKGWLTQEQYWNSIER